MTDKLTETVERLTRLLCIHDPCCSRSDCEQTARAIAPKLAALSLPDEGVTQADREQAWPFARFHCLPDSQMRERWFEGHYDDLTEGAAIQAFRAHRVAALRGSQS